MTALKTFTTASKQPLTTGRRPDMTGICAKGTAGVDVQRPLRIAGSDIADLPRHRRLPPDSGVTRPSPVHAHHYMAFLNLAASSDPPVASPAL